MQKEGKAGKEDERVFSKVWTAQQVAFDKLEVSSLHVLYSYMDLIAVK